MPEIKNLALFAMLVFLPMQYNGVGSRADTGAMQAVTGQWPGRLTAGRRGHFRNEEAARGLNRGWVIHGKDRYSRVGRLFDAAHRQRKKAKGFLTHFTK